MTPRLVAPDTAEAVEERDAVSAGRLPARYAEPWRQAFLDGISAALRPGVRILDVGSGAHPSIPVKFRPARCFYAGLDRSAGELERAPAGSYDEAIVADICSPFSAIPRDFDLVLSWQVLEHVESMCAALASQHEVLSPGGRLIAQLSGKWSVFAVGARVIPFGVRTKLQESLLGVDPDDKFPTNYDCCSYDALQRLLLEGGWAAWRITPRYKAAGYFRFSRTLQSMYLPYENWVERNRYCNLATHYLLEATK